MINSFDSLLANTNNSRKSNQIHEPKSGMKSNMAIVQDAAIILPYRKPRWETKQKKTREETHAAYLNEHRQIFADFRNKDIKSVRRVLVMKPHGRKGFKLIAQGGVIVKNTAEAIEYGKQHGYTHVKKSNSDKLENIRG